MADHLRQAKAVQEACCPTVRALALPPMDLGAGWPRRVFHLPTARGRRRLPATADQVICCRAVRTLVPAPMDLAADSRRPVFHRLGAMVGRALPPTICQEKVRQVFAVVPAEPEMGWTK